MFLPSPTCPVNMHGSHSPCSCPTHLWQATRVHMKLMLCWGPHMIGSSCQQMALWHCAGLMQLSWQAMAPSLASNMSPYEACVVLGPPHDGLQLPTDGIMALLDTCSCPGKHAMFLGCWTPTSISSLLPPCLLHTCNSVLPMPPPLYAKASWRCFFFHILTMHHQCYLPHMQNEPEVAFFSCFDNVLPTPPPSHAKVSRRWSLSMFHFASTTSLTHKASWGSFFTFQQGVLFKILVVNCKIQ